MARSFCSLRKPSSVDPVSLIFDGHCSHNKNLAVVVKDREHSVAIISLPLHSMHEMQPLDVGIMKSLKIYYTQEIKIG